MKMMTRLMIALSLTLVSDKAFNHGRLTIGLADQGGTFTHWAQRSGDEVADTFIGFRS